MALIESFLYRIASSSSSPNIDISSVETGTIVRLAKMHRLKDPLMKWNHDLSIDGENWTTRVANEKSKLDEVGALFDALNKERVNYVLLKGLALRWYYPEDIPRQSNDFDFLLKSIDDLWKSFYIISNLGYEFESYPSFVQNGNTLALCKFIKHITDELHIRLEFNVGGFILSERTWLDDKDLWNITRNIQYNGQVIPVLSDEMNLVVLIAEIGGNRYLTIRNAVDYRFILDNCSIDWHFVELKLKKWALQHEFRSLVKISHLLSRDVYTTKTGNFRRSFTRRICRDAFHILPLLRKETGFPVKILHYYTRLFFEFLSNKDFLLRVVKAFDYIWSARRNFDHGGVTHFIPMSMSTTGPWSWKEIHGLHLVRTPIGTFLASNFCIHREDEIEQATELAASAFN